MIATIKATAIRILVAEGMTTTERIAAECGVTIKTARDALFEMRDCFDYLPSLQVWALAVSRR